MEIQQLRHLVAAAQSSSFAEAARECFTSRQNIAHSVKALENELHINIFERSRNGIMLTPAGHQAVYYAQEIVSEVDALRALFIKPEFGDIELNLAVSTNLFAGLPPRTSAVINESVPWLHIVEVDCEECYQKICSHQVDFAFIMSMDRTFQGCRTIPIETSRAYAIVGRQSQLAHKASFDINDLRHQRLLVMSNPWFQYRPLFQQLDSLGYDSNQASVIQSSSTMLRIIRRTDAAGIVSKRFILNPPEGTIGIPLADPHFDWYFYIIYPADTPNFRTIMDFTQKIQDSLRNKVVADETNAFS